MSNTPLSTVIPAWIGCVVSLSGAIGKTWSWCKALKNRPKIAKPSFGITEEHERPARTPYVVIDNLGSAPLDVECVKFSWGSAACDLRTAILDPLPPRRGVDKDPASPESRRRYYFLAYDRHPHDDELFEDLLDVSGYQLQVLVRGSSKLLWQAKGAKLQAWQDCVMNALDGPVSITQRWPKNSDVS